MDNIEEMEQGTEDNKECTIEQLGEAILELQARKGDSVNTVEWVEIKQHFIDLEASLNKKLEELQGREKEYELKQLELNSLLSERKAAVVSKEQDLLDRLQELKDEAVVSIVEARVAHQIAVPLESPVVYDDDRENKDAVNKVSVSMSVSGSGSPTEEFSNSEVGPHPELKHFCEQEFSNSEVGPHPELKHFCERMDAIGLVNYLVGNKKKMSVIREEISVALESATDPARLVLDSLVGFYPATAAESTAALEGKRKSCVLILEAMASLLARADPGGADHFLNPQTKQQAKAIADEWKPNLASVDIHAASNGNSLEAEAFLQLISTFRIASEFAEEELCKLVLAVAQHRWAPELCRSIGLTHKMPGVIELLVNNGKHIAAVHFVHFFQLQESFPPVPLLKTYLKNRRRNSQVTGNLRDIASAKNDANAQELAALKNVIKCIEEYKLEPEYPLDTLQKRVYQLEKSKVEKKRGGGEFNRRPQSKRPRPNERHFSLRSSGGSIASNVAGRQVPPVRTAYAGTYAATADRQVPPVRTAYAGTVDRYPHYSASAVTHDYQVPGAAIYPPPPANAATPDYGRYLGSSLQSSHYPYI